VASAQTYPNHQAELLREYVWGLDYIDELVAIVSAGTSDPQYILQDTNHNVVGVIDNAGNIQQYNYTPYGELRLVEDVPTCGTPPCTTVTPLDYAANPSALQVDHFHQGLYADHETGLIHNRARAYNPRIGRFNERDPNGSGVLLTSVLARNAMSRQVFSSVDAGGMYVDGLNPYEYLRTNPTNGTDPTGQFTYMDTLITAGLAGGLYTAASTYAHFDDSGSKWKIAASFAKGAGMGTFAAMGFGLLSSALASYAGISVAAATTSIGLMTSPAMLGLSVDSYQDAETYADRVMAGIDIGLAGTAVIATHAAAYSAGGDTLAILTAAARRAHARVGPGSGHAHGSRVHTALKHEVQALGRSDLHPEASYLNGKYVRYGSPGIRVDVAEGPVDAPYVIYDLKTGGAKLTQRRIAEIRRHLPPASQGAPIVEIR
jgi:RHS repeat-associated protein